MPEKVVKVLRTVKKLSQVWGSRGALKLPAPSEYATARNSASNQIILLCSIEYRI